jgi:hypothetical protein
MLSKPEIGLEHLAYPVGAVTCENAGLNLLLERGNPRRGNACSALKKKVREHLSYCCPHLGRKLWIHGNAFDCLVCLVITVFLTIEGL